MAVSEEEDPETGEMIQVRDDPSEMEWIKVMEDGKPIQEGFEAHLARLDGAQAYGAKGAITLVDDLSVAGGGGEVNTMLDVIVPELKDLEGKDIQVNQATGEIMVTNEAGEVTVQDFVSDPDADNKWIKIAEDGRALEEGIKQLEQSETQQRILLDIIQEQGQELDQSQNQDVQNNPFQFLTMLFEALFSGGEIDFEEMFAKMKDGVSNNEANSDSSVSNDQENDLAGFELAGGDDMGTKLVEVEKPEDEQPKTSVENTLIQTM